MGGAAAGPLELGAGFEDLGQPGEQPARTRRRAASGPPARPRRRPAARSRSPRRTSGRRRRARAPRRASSGDHHHGRGSWRGRRAPGPSTSALKRGSSRMAASPSGAVAAPHHDGGELRGVDAERLRRRGDGDEARSDPQGRPGGEPRRAGPRRAAGSDQGVAALVFVGREPGPRQRSAPESGPVREGPVAEPAQNVSGAMPMSATVDRPAMDAPGNRSMARLAGREGDRPRRPDRAAPRTSPVSPSIPEGMSTARTGRPDALTRSTRRAASPSRSRARPAPKSASITRPASPGSACAGGTTRRPSRPPRRRRRPQAAPGAPSSATVDRVPALARSRAATKPSPPLLPGPHMTSTGPGAVRHPGRRSRDGRAGPLHQLDPRGAGRDRRARRPPSSPRWSGGLRFRHLIRPAQHLALTWTPVRTRDVRRHLHYI